MVHIEKIFKKKKKIHVSRALREQVEDKSKWKKERTRS